LRVGGQFASPERGSPSRSTSETSTVTGKSPRPPGLAKLLRVRRPALLWQFQQIRDRRKSLQKATGATRWPVRHGLPAMKIRRMIRVAADLMFDHREASRGTERVETRHAF